ncbi:hypothetical protein AWN76_011170 [Rhodothermaceae bacterium RA]|nr:hypothetical protein AWN76_011170 [Rhodothermaceae bacterium RA]
MEEPLQTRAEQGPGDGADPHRAAVAAQERLLPEPGGHLLDRGLPDLHRGDDDRAVRGFHRHLHPGHDGARQRLGPVVPGDGTGHHLRTPQRRVHGGARDGRPAGAVDAGAPGPLVLTDLHFAYPQAPDRPVLQGIDLTIEPGERVALIGRNGSGKTTLAKLLAGLYHEYEGTITLGGVELRRLHPRALRRTVAMVPQQVHLFDGTFKDNIRYGNPEASMDDIVRAAELAGLHEDVQPLYLGYNTMIGESGSALSGGQRLKIAFARLFLTHPDVIILDEASSALDPEAERLVMRNVETHFAGKTILSIAHRLRTVRNADRILVMDRGRIVEDGRHEDLLQREGLYYSLMQTYLNF